MCQTCCGDLAECHHLPPGSMFFLKSLGMFLFGALDPIHAVGDLSIASAERALEIIDVESKNTLITVTSSVVLPMQSGLEQAGFVCTVSVLCCGLILLRSGCAVSSLISYFGRRIREHWAPDPSNIQGIHLPQRINRGFGYLDPNDLLQGK